MSLPLNFADISLLLAFVAIVLLITSELFSFYYGKINIQINKGRLRNVALVISMLFLATLALRIANMVLTV